MDIHRCRFVPYPLSAINTLAFSNPNKGRSVPGSTARLAVGRANGDVEIWNPSGGTWHQEIVMRGGKDRSTDGLVWVNEPDQDLGGGRIMLGKSRLFSIGYTSTVTEWDLEKGKPKRHASGQHGDIWCLAAQPSNSAADSSSRASQVSNKLVVGTIDGELLMYSVEDDDLRFQRVLVKAPTKKSQIVSITFQSRKVVVVGCSDSTIRIYDINRGHMLRRMTLGSDLVGGAKDIIVWSVKCLPNGNIVSGDSTGQICIWDGVTYTQSQRIQDHKQDVLSLAVSADGTAIVSGGMDRRTFLYKQTSSSVQRWGKVWGRRFHHHDVKAMASFEHGHISVVVSGGPDANLMIVPFKEMGRNNHRTMSNMPQQPPVMSALNARFVVSWWDREVHVWVLRKPSTELFESACNGVDIDQNRKLLKSIVVKGDSNIASAAISQDGTFLVVSTATAVKAFRLTHQDPAKPSDVSISTVELPQRLTHLGATHVKLSPSGEWLCLVQEGSRVLMAGIHSVPGAENSSSFSVQPQRLPRLRRHVPRHIQNGGLGSYDRNITQVAFSADSKMVAVADLAGYIDTWILRGHEESLQNGKGGVTVDDAASSSGSDSSEQDEALGASEQWVRNANAKQLPKLPASPVALAFSDSVPKSHDPLAAEAGGIATASDYVLAAITSSWHVLAFHPRHGSLTAWSRRHPRESMPAEVQTIIDLPRGILWHESRMWVYGASFLLMLDVGQDLPRPDLGVDVQADSQVVLGTKRKRSGGARCKMGKESLAPHTIRKHGDAEHYEDVEVGETPRGGGSDTDDEMPDADDGISQLRRADSGDDDRRQVVETPAKPELKKWWLTYKYRSILGMARLSARDQPLEVALVEMPSWDLQMPERFFDGHEWDR